ncbi:MAG: cupin domain-containing protein [Actinomycetota bacterium]|nr:cupin domain-containing protein [Actinomycetota bacterium]
MGAPALERCVGDVGTFFDHYWGSAPLFRSRPRPDHADSGFDDLASVDDLDRIVASLGLSSSDLRMVQDGKPLPSSSYTKRAVGNFAGMEAIAVPLVYARFYEGASIVIEALHRHWQPLTDFSRDLELALGHRVQVNAYITPPGSQGFAVHRDDHDVFVLQVWGEKRWMVFHPEADDRVVMDRTLNTGSSLYIPAGFPHSATTRDSASAHLTVGILTHRSIDILREVTKLAEEEPAFQERLRPGYAADAVSLRSMVQAELEDLRTWMDKIDVDQLTERVARRVMSTSQPLIRGMLRQLQELDAIDEETTLLRRRGATCILFPGATLVKVLLADRELQMPLATRAAMEEIARRDSLQVHDLHPFLDPESALVLVRRLVREGLLEVVVGG